jgi:hypothetical protein
MKTTSEEYEEEGLLEDQDEVPELAGTIDNSCLIASELGDDIVLPQDRGKGLTVPVLVQRCW